MRTLSLAFDGAILRRGYWIYVVQVRCGRRQFYYVGRTGDSSSANAASLFTRLSNHLNLSPKAKANALARKLRDRRLDASKARYRVWGLRMDWPEPKSFRSHIPGRNKAAAIEREVAEWLRAKGYSVVGQHDSRTTPDRNLLRRVKASLRGVLPPAG